MVVRLIFLSLFFFLSTIAFSADEADSSSEFVPSEMIVHHVLDDHIWHFFDGHYGTLYLPVIVYSEAKGLDVFSSANFYDDNHKVKEYAGYKLDHGHITLTASGESVLDLSITKNVLMLFLNTALLVVALMLVARKYKNSHMKAPSGFQNLIESIVVYLRDEVVRPNIGDKYEKFLPYLLTLFFFILFGNILGLMPGAANLTGNIAVTMVLAIFTFFYTNLNGKKGYWMHIFWPPGVPAPLKPIIVLVEFIGIFTKPISLMVRLFVAITAGHIVMLSLISLVFIFGSIYVGIGSTLIVLFINIIEILVAFIQAYVFTMFSSLYIGMAIEDHH
jgi:F-type H+-transporting ATPase subunit a